MSGRTVKDLQGEPYSKSHSARPASIVSVLKFVSTLMSIFTDYFEVSENVNCENEGKRLCKSGGYYMQFTAY